MEYDFLFTIVYDQNWKEITTDGVFAPASLEDSGYIKCIDESQLQEYINSDNLKDKQLILVVIDPLRVKDSIKSDTENGFKVIKLSGSLTLDAIIDKIHLDKAENGNHKISVKHYD